MIETLLTQLIEATKSNTAATSRNNELLEKVILAGAKVPDAQVDAAAGQTRLAIVDEPAPAKVKKEKLVPATVAAEEPARELPESTEPVYVTPRPDESDPKKLRLLIQTEVKDKLKLGPEYKAKFDAERIAFGVPTASALPDERLVEFLEAVRLW